MLWRLRGLSKDFRLYSKNNAEPSKDLEQESGSCFSRAHGAETETREGGSALQESVRASEQEGDVAWVRR